MTTNSIKPQNLPETLVWYCIILMYPIYFLGAPYVVAPLLGTFLVVYLLKQWWQQAEMNVGQEKNVVSMPALVYLVALLIIGISISIGHINHELGLNKLIASLVNRWYRTFALFPLFILAGHLSIRPQLIYRAVCIFGLQSLIVWAIDLIGSLAGLAAISYVSPLAIFGGGDPYYSISLFDTLNGGTYRYLTLGPWPTFLGGTACIFFWIASQESSLKWRCLGMIGTAVIALATMSRSVIIGIPFSGISVWLLLNFLRPRVHFAFGLISFSLALLSPDMSRIFLFFKAVFNSFRENSGGSTNTRIKIYRMAIRLWQEAPIWGHGTLFERGPTSVGFMPVGSHQTWLGLLVTSGLVGFLAAVIAGIWGFIDLLLKAKNSRTAQLGLYIYLVLLVGTFTDNVEAYAYLYWPALILLGIAHQEKFLLTSQNKQKFEVC